MTDHVDLFGGAPEAGSPPPGRKYLTVREAAFIGVGSMVGAGIFALLGAAGAVAGAAVWLSFLIAGAIAMLQGYSFAKLGARYPSAGGMLEYVAKGFGDGHFTGITAWLVYLANAIVTAMVAVSFGSYASSMLTGEEKAVWIKVFAALIIIVMTGVNIAGSKLVANAQSVIVVVVVGILTFFAVVLLVNIHAHLLAPSGYPGWNDIISSVALTFFAFLGFGIITFTAKDLRKPSRELPRAMFIALGIATVIYVAIALGVFGTLTVEKVISSGGTALAVAAEPTLGKAGYWLMSITALFATAGATNAGLYPAPGLSERLAGNGAAPAADGAQARRPCVDRAGHRGGGVPDPGRGVQSGRDRLHRQRRGPADLHADHRGPLPGPVRDRREPVHPRARDRVGGRGPGGVRVQHPDPRAGLDRRSAGHHRAGHRPGLVVETGAGEPGHAGPGRELGPQGSRQ
jgi:amino acid permease